MPESAREPEYHAHRGCFAHHIRLSHRDVRDTESSVDMATKDLAPAEMEKQNQFPSASEDEICAAFLEAEAQFERNIDALEGEKAELQRFGDDVHAIAAEIGIAMHPNIPFGEVLEIAASHGNKRAKAWLEKLRADPKLYPRAP
jgi:hypothetical protein